MKENPKKRLDYKKVNAYLKHQGLQVLIDKIKILDEIKNIVSHYFEPHLIKHLQIANYQSSQLTILAENASIATQLRFQKNHLLDQFKKDHRLQNIKQIHIKVSPKDVSFISYASKLQKMPKLSAATAEIVANIAETISDNDLRVLMKKIASHRE